VPRPSGSFVMNKSQYANTACVPTNEARDRKYDAVAVPSALALETGEELEPRAAEARIAASALDMSADKQSKKDTQAETSQATASVQEAGRGCNFDDRGRTEM
jgi:hypothetical protein